MLRPLHTAVAMLKEKGIVFTLWYSVRKIFHLRFSRRRNRNFQADNESPPSVTVAERPLLLHPSIRGLSETVYLYGVHEPTTTKVYLENLRCGDHVLEIGANIGYYILQAHSAVGSTGRIIGVEPVPDIVAILRKNVAHYNNVEIFELAIGDRSGFVDFHVSEVPNWGSLLYREKLLVKEKIKTRVLKLDDFLCDFEDFHPTMIHMDIEGGEMMALKGARQTIAKYKPRLFIEFHPFATGVDPAVEALQGLIELGYHEIVLIDRLWDEPWIPEWLRNRRCMTGSLVEFVGKLSNGSCPDNFSLLVKAGDQVFD